MNETSPRPISVLLVDDENDLVELLTERLRHHGFDCVGATSGEQALAVCEHRPFDVAIIDLKMPGLDGVEVMQRIRMIRPFTEMIMFTGHGTTDSALAAGKLDAFRYLLKPCDFDKLVQTIQEAAAHRRQRLREAYQAELEKIMEHASTPRDILEASERLRREYEQE